MSVPKPNNSLPSLQALYDQNVQNGNIARDQAQLEVITRLQEFYEDTGGKPSNFCWLPRRQKPEGQTHGVYIYGDVGRGKSMIMDLFYEFLPIQKKRRDHFHSFMAELHQELHTIRKHGSKQDPLKLLAQSVAKQKTWLFLDEMQITDITDAMLVGRFFELLLTAGCIIITTSNRAPEDLYKDGLQRERFLPFIDLIRQKLQVVSLNSPIDYRLTFLRSLESCYITPLGKDADHQLLQAFKSLTQHAIPTPTIISSLGRSIEFTHTHGDVALIHFRALCETALGPSDYLEIAKTFSTILLTNIPKLTTEKRNEAKRFVTFIDQCYEQKVKLICSAEVKESELYQEGDGAFEFERTVSRLYEMQSEAYRALPHLS